MARGRAPGGTGWPTANFCGDGLPHPSEACDAGEANGTGQHEEGFVACSATCNLDAYRVFISSTELTGKLGGLTGADLHCQNLARAVGWTEWTRFRAWLSDGSTAAKDRVAGSKPAWPYALVNGRRVAMLRANTSIRPGRPAPVIPWRPSLSLE